jgi:hypothetical protein
MIASSFNTVAPLVDKAIAIMRTVFRMGTAGELIKIAKGPKIAKGARGQSGPDYLKCATRDLSLMAGVPAVRDRSNPGPILV